MKFVSKFAQLRVVLKPGLPGNRQLGTPSTPMVSVRFENGIAEVKNPELIELMLADERCGKIGDLSAPFMPIAEEEIDPFLNKRPNIEPAHNMIPIENGRVGAVATPARKAPLTYDEQMEMLKKMATDLAVKMVSEIQSKPQTKPITPGTVENRVEVIREKENTDPRTCAAEPVADESDGVYESSDDDIEPLNSPGTTKPITTAIDPVGDANSEPTEEAPIVKRPGRPAKTK